MSKESEEEINKKEAVLTPLRPQWVQTDIIDKFTSEEFKKLFGFYVVCNPFVKASYSRKDSAEYGWHNERVDNLKGRLCNVAKLVDKKTFYNVDKIDKMREPCDKLDLKEDFYMRLNDERVVIFIKKKEKEVEKVNIISGVLYHIRNAFAHGRYAVYECENKIDNIVVLEDVDPQHKYRGKIAVSARMVLKKSTLLKWIDIIEAGPNSEEYQQYLQIQQSSKKPIEEKKENV